MTQHDNTNRGAIWKNDDKQEDKHPDFKGSLNVNGVDYWVSAWKRKEGSSAKTPALTFSIKPKGAQNTVRGANIKPADDDMDGERIPF